MADRHRKWFIRVTKSNNTKQGLYEYDFDKLYEDLASKYDNVLFASHDKDKENIHCHIVLQHKNAIAFDTLKQLIPYGDIEKQRGNNQECYNYALHIDSKSKDKEKDLYTIDCIKTNIQDLENWCNIKQGAREDLEEFTQAIMSGATQKQLLTEYKPQVARYEKYYNFCRQTYLEETFGKKLRDVDVVYIYGGAGLGKTYSIYNEFGADNIYSVDDYSHPFDMYDAQDVLVLDEYRSNFDITYLLKLLDKYPLKLRARYSNKIACYTKVFIISNIPLSEQYKNSDNDTKFALMRRIKTIKHYTAYNKFTETKNNDIALIPVNDNEDDVFK